MRYQCFCHAFSRCLQASLLLGWLVGSGSGATVYGQVSVPRSPFIVNAHHLTVEQGLPNRYVFTVGQDKTGFVWIGTLDNAYRYDGQRFHALPADANTPKNKRYSPEVSSTLHDPVGNLWLLDNLNSAYSKLLILPPGSPNPVPAETAFDQPWLFGADPIRAFVERNGQSFQYLLTRGGQIIQCTQAGRFVPIGRYAQPGETVTLLGQLETPQSHLLLSVATPQTPNQSTLLVVNARGQVIRRQALPHRLKPVWSEPDGTVYLQASTGRGEAINLPRLTAHQLTDFLFRLAPDGTLTSLPIPFAASPFPDNDPDVLREAHARYDPFRKLFWISGMRTCFAWHPAHGIVFDLRKTDLFTNSLQQFRAAFIDRTGAVWFGTDDGIVMLTVESDRFTRYFYEADPKSDAARSSIRGMVQQGNRLWVNTATSEWLDLKTGRSEPVVPATDSVHRYLKGMYPALGTTQGDIWGASVHLIHRDGATKQITMYPFARNGIHNFGVALWHDGQHRILIGHEYGLSEFDTRQKKVRPFSRYNQFGELAQNYINGFFPDAKAGDGRYAASPAPANRSTRVWVAASSGLYLLDTLRGIIARYSTHNKALPFDHIMYVHPDPEHPGVYWLATRGGGLIRWNRTTGSYEQFTTKQGLSDNTLYTIYEDRLHRLWLPSDYGLMAFHRQTHQVQIFHTKDGIAHEEFNRTAFCRTADGQLLFGGLNGITAFYPDQIQIEKPKPAPLLVTQYHKLNVNTGQMIDFLADYQQQAAIELTADDRLFSLSFAVLDYRYLGKTRLRYRLIGWQDKWVIQPQMELRINGLPAGHYTLDVQAQTINGDWISRVVTIPIRVAKPFYRQTWFLLLLAAALAFGLRLYLRYRDRRLIRENDRLEQEVARRTARIEQDKLIIEKQATDLQTSAMLKIRFFANVSHEFRTPLTLLLGPIQYLAKRITDGSAQQLLMAMERNANQLLTLVNSILDLTRLDSHELLLSEQPADLSQLTQQTVGNFMAQAQYAGVHLRVSGADQPRWLALDTQKIETVLRNLLANALTYTPAGGSIEVSLSQTDQQAFIEVADTGSGIHPDDLPHVFERYFQTSQTDKPLRGGTGIGLALCQEYCQLWGGTLRVSSELNKGSTFVVSYPLRVIAPATDRLPDQPVVADSPILTVMEPAISLAEDVASTDVSATNIRLLLVDDHADMLRYIQTILTPDYKLILARNGREALTLLKDLPAAGLPNLIISDIMMPEVDGFVLVTELRASPTLRAIPIILLTARMDIDTRLQALRLGIADYLTKPFVDDELRVRIQNLLRRSEERSIWQQAAEETIKLPAGLSDEDWTDFVQQIIRENLTDPQFTVRTLAELTHVSERQLYRRTKELMGFSPNQLIQEVRLQVAHELLEKQPHAMVKQISYQVGYQKISYFTQIYRERFGVEPGKRQTHLEPVRVDV